MNSVYQFIQTSLQTSLHWLVSWMERSSVFKQRVIITEYKILKSAQVVLWYCPHPLCLLITEQNQNRRKVLLRLLYLCKFQCAEMNNCNPLRHFRGQAEEALIPFLSRTAVASHVTSSRSVLPVSPLARFTEPFFRRSK